MAVLAEEAGATGVVCPAGFYPAQWQVSPNWEGCVVSPSEVSTQRACGIGPGGGASEKTQQASRCH